MIAILIWYLESSSFSFDNHKDINKKLKQFENYEFLNDKEVIKIAWDVKEKIKNIILIINWEEYWSYYSKENKLITRKLQRSLWWLNNNYTFEFYDLMVKEYFASKMKSTDLKGKIKEISELLREKTFRDILEEIYEILEAYKISNQDESEKNSLLEFIGILLATDYENWINKMYELKNDLYPFIKNIDKDTQSKIRELYDLASRIEIIYKWMKEGNIPWTSQAIQLIVSDNLNVFWLTKKETKDIVKMYLKIPIN